MKDHITPPKHVGASRLAPYVYVTSPHLPFGHTHIFTGPLEFPDIIVVLKCGARASAFDMSSYEISWSPTRRFDMNLS